VIAALPLSAFDVASYVVAAASSYALLVAAGNADVTQVVEGASYVAIEETLHDVEGDEQLVDPGHSKRHLDADSSSLPWEPPGGLQECRELHWALSTDSERMPVLLFDVPQSHDPITPPPALPPPGLDSMILREQLLRLDL
jgi:hypothetical protein